jgi:radical SAM protein with 4Fe4S-binding SPASM domain
MDFDLFKKVVDECASYKVSSIHLHNFGEPFIDKGIFDKIRYATGKGISTRLFSNISLLDREKAVELVESGLTRIKVSIDGNSKETFNVIRKGLDFDTVVENINTLIDVKKELGSKKPEIGLVFVETEKNAHERAGFMERWKGRVDSIDISSYHNWGGSLHKGERGDERGLPCLRVWQTFTVLWNGEVSICCMDYDGKVILGNVKEESVYDIFNGQKLREIRRKHLKGDFSRPPICKRCEARR